jgi:acetoacetyl-CoA reductase
MNVTTDTIGEVALPEKPLKDAVALVTGASRGIGATIAEELASCGAAVIVNYIERASDAALLVERLRSSGAVAQAVQADVRDRDEIDRAVDRIVTEYGRIDVLVNNAGILRDRSIRNLRGEEWDEVIGTNLTGVFNVTRAIAPHMIAARRGCIVNISSIIGQTGNFGQANYSAAKAGIIGLTKTLALELARYGVRANAICPGFVNTSMWQSIPADVRENILAKIPLGRVAEPADIARGVRYLIVDAPYVTGETLNINGGLFMA